MFEILSMAESYIGTLKRITRNTNEVNFISTLNYNTFFRTKVEQKLTLKTMSGFVQSLRSYLIKRQLVKGFQLGLDSTNISQ
jgi:hypothetical protein